MIFIFKKVKNIFPVFILVLVLFAGCVSGFTHNPFGSAKVTSPVELASLQGGSLSTIWYYGSDADYHYFKHFIKISTPYRIKREDLNWPNEFTFSKNNKGVFAGEKLLQIVNQTNLRSSAPSADKPNSNF